MSLNAEYSISAQWIIYVNGPKRHSRGILLRAKGDFSDRVHSDQMVLMMARWEGGPCEVELENSSRKPMTKSENSQSDSLKRFNLLFLRVRRREMKLWMMKMMIQWEPVCHKTELQEHCVLRNCSSLMSLNTILKSRIIWLATDIYVYFF
jgi:hypothetical protein